MIFDATSLPRPLRLRTQLCVIGSGAGGATAAMAAAEAGIEVLVLEAGELLVPGDMSQREEEMIPRLMWANGARTTSNRAVKIYQGRGVGGSTLHNTNLCKRIPDPIFEKWSREHRLEQLGRGEWDALYERVETLLEVAPIARSDWNDHNLIFEAGAQALGWQGGGLSHNRTGCVGSGFCELGCAYDAKNNAAKVIIPRAIAAGAQVLSNCQAVRIEHAHSRVRKVVARALDPVTQRPVGEVEIITENVCVAGSGTGTPALLLRSGVPDPYDQIGQSLRIHPALVVAGDFDREIRAWEGIPQAFECTEHLQLDREDGHRVWIVPAFAHPVGTATLVPGHGDAHRRIMGRYAHLAGLTAMIHDHTRGRVRPDGDLGLSIDYWPNAEDRSELLFGLRAATELMFAAGARRVLIATDPPRILEAGSPLDDLPMELPPHRMDVSAVHPMASVPMDDDPRQGGTSSAGQLHHMHGLWVADGSLFPGSIGGPPQLSIYALGLHVGRSIAESLSSKGARP